MWKLVAVIEEPSEVGIKRLYVEFPMVDRKITDILKQIGHDPSAPHVHVTSIVPKELSPLCRNTLDLNEINYLAKRMSGLSWKERITYRAVLEAFEPNTVEAAINTSFNLGCYFFVKYGRSLQDIGYDYLMACFGYIDPIFINSLHEIGSLLMASGKGIQTSYGYVFRIGEEKKLKRLPEYL